MRNLATFYLILWAMILCGCARRPAAPGGLTFVIGKECHPTAVVTGCDQDSPPSCAKIALTYEKGCEQLVAAK